MKTFKGGYLVGLLLLAIGCLSFAGIRSKQRKISDIDIIFNGGDARFLSVDIVNKLLIQSNDSLFFQQKDMVALKEIEQQLLRYPVIKTAQLYTVPQGKLYVEIDERDPIVRVQGERAYYVDEFGVEIPLSNRYSARVPLFYGELKSDKKQEMIQLLSKLTTESFFKEELVDIHLEAEGFVLGLRNFPFEVFWGKNTNFSEKTEKLKRFCAYTNQNQVNKFNRIDLSYTRQVVAR